MISAGRDVRNQSPADLQAAPGGIAGSRGGLPILPSQRDTGRAMSHENVIEVVERAFEAWSRGDIDTYLSHLCSDVEAVPFGAALEGKVCRGHDEVRAWWRAQSEVWETFVLCAEEFMPVGAGLVVSGRWEAVGRSGVKLSAPAAWVFGFSGEKIAYWQAYTSRAAALEAVELSE